jgi:hypothetical protein
VGGRGAALGTTPRGGDSLLRNTNTQAAKHHHKQAQTKQQQKNKNRTDESDVR